MLTLGANSSYRADSSSEGMACSETEEIKKLSPLAEMAKKYLVYPDPLRRCII